MSSHAETRERWRAQAEDRRLMIQLLSVGFPLTIRQALARGAASDLALRAWAASALASGRILRTAQSEMLAAGRSLNDVASETGITPRRVLHHLTRPAEHIDEDA